MFKISYPPIFTYTAQFIENVPVMLQPNIIFTQNKTSIADEIFTFHNKDYAIYTLPDSNITIFGNNIIIVTKNKTYNIPRDKKDITIPVGKYTFTCQHKIYNISYLSFDKSFTLLDNSNNYKIIYDTHKTEIYTPGYHYVNYYTNNCQVFEFNDYTPLHIKNIIYTKKVVEKISMVKLLNDNYCINMHTKSFYINKNIINKLNINFSYYHNNTNLSDITFLIKQQDDIITMKIMIIEDDLSLKNFTSKINHDNSYEINNIELCDNIYITELLKTVTLTMSYINKFRTLEDLFLLFDDWYITPVNTIK